MADSRTTPYPAFNFTVSFANDDTTFGGFSDVSGLMTELTVAEYRAGNDLENHVHKVQVLTKAGDVTFKRGLIDSGPVWEWIRSARIDGPDAKKDVMVTLLNERRDPVQKWVLYECIPLKWTGPTLAGKGGGEVAMEEMVLSVEMLDQIPL